jgi:hypothetical protein
VPAFAGTTNYLVIPVKAGIYIDTVIPSPKTYFINAFRVSSVCIGLGTVSTIQDRVYFFKEVNGNGIKPIPFR